MTAAALRRQMMVGGFKTNLSLAQELGTDQERIARFLSGDVAIPLYMQIAIDAVVAGRVASRPSGVPPDDILKTFKPKRGK